jgi:hypothetical protein
MPTPDPGIKKVIIPKESLPAFLGSEHKYVVRYRVVSEDRNRLSHWSLQYKVAAPTVSQINYSIIPEQDANVIRLVWDQVPNIAEFDVYVKWGNGSWQYIATSLTSTFTSLIKSGTTSVAFAVQVPTFPKERFSGSTLFESTVTQL